MRMSNKKYLTAITTRPKPAFSTATRGQPMKTFVSITALLLASAAPAFAQDVTSGSASGAEANSGSISGAESNGNQQGQSQANIGGNNAGIGSSTSESNSGAVSGSSSHSGAISDQGQSQSQGQSVGAHTNTVGQAATNQQGVTTAITFNSTNHKRSYVGTNTAVPLAASSSFSSDYCGGTASGGASVAPIGLSIGGAAPVFDDTCRYIRLAQTAGMMAANWHNMGEMDMRNRMMTFATWSTCMAGPQADKRQKHSKPNVVMEACLRLGLLGSESSPISPPTAPVTPPEAYRATPPAEDYSDLPPKTPRGDADQLRKSPAISAVMP